MGYVTEHTFSVYMLDGAEVPPATLASIREEAVDELSTSLGCVLNDPPYVSKWYRSLDDLGRVSGSYPGVLFVLDCRGEDGARWREYAANGRTQTCEGIVVYESFAPTRWQPSPAQVLE